MTTAPCAALSDCGITFRLWLREPKDAPRVFRIDDLGDGAHIRWIRMTMPDQLDEALQRLICASYEVGAGRR